MARTRTPTRSLRVAINNAKAQNLSRDNIEAAIKRAAGKDAADISEVTYECKGPHGSQFIIECATDNSNRSVTNIKTILNKNHGQMVNSGALDFMFSRKSVIEFPKPEGKDLEEIELELIDAGLEEMIVDDDQVSVIGDYTAFAQLCQAVEALGIVATKSSLQRLPNQPIELTEEQIEEVEAHRGQAGGRRRRAGGLHESRLIDPVSATVGFAPRASSPHGRCPSGEILVMFSSRITSRAAAY